MKKVFSAYIIMILICSALSLIVINSTSLNNSTEGSGNYFNTFNSKEIIESPNNDDLLRSGGFFTENVGQVGTESVRFYIQDNGIWFLDDGGVFEITESPQVESLESRSRESTAIMDRLHPEVEPKTSAPRESVVLKLNFLGCNKVEPVGIGLLPHRSNFFYGNDSSKWSTNVPNYQEVLYENLYDNIDLRYYFSNEGLKYDFIINPGGDPESIKLSYDGAQGIRLLGDNSIEIQAPLGYIVDTGLFIYQETNDERHEIAGNFKILDKTTFGFNIISKYDHSQKLIIDPLVYSSFFGGDDNEFGNDIGMDSNGDLIVVGITDSINFPNTTLANDSTPNGGTDIFVLKLDPTTSTLLYSTYIGGISNDEGNSIYVDSANCAYITGSTLSSNFPTTPGAFDEVYDNQYDIIVSKLDTTGSTLLFSTFVGGMNGDYAESIAADSSNNLYVTGWTWSSDFPITPGAFDNAYNVWTDAYLIKLNSGGSSLLYCSYLGGDGNHNKGRSIAVDASGYAYITGETWSPNFPTKSGSYDTSYNGDGDGFVVKMTPAGTGSNDLLYSTYLGGDSNDYGYDITLDPSNKVYVTGYTESSDFPYTSGAYDTSHNGGIDVFVTKLNLVNTGNNDLIFSTFIGGSISQWGESIVVDSYQNMYVIGPTISHDFPTTPGTYDDDFSGNYDGFILKLDLTGSKLLYSTFIGGNNEDSLAGIVIDNLYSVYTTGYTMSVDFPITTNTYDPSHNGNKDVIVLNLNLSSFYVEDLICSPSSVYRNNSTNIHSKSNHTFIGERNLLPHFEYQSPEAQIWTTTYLSNPHHNSINSRWEIEFKPSINAELGYYNLRVRFNDTNMFFTEWFYLNGSLEVLNNFPRIENITQSIDTAVLGDIVFIWVNCSDVEEPVQNLTIELEHQGPFDQLWNKTYLGPPEFIDNWWKFSFYIPFNATFGFYDFRARCNDSVGNFSDWSFTNNSLLIYNVNPKIGDIEFSKNIIYRTEFITISINGTDHETPESKLKLKIQYRHENEAEWTDLISKYSKSWWSTAISTDVDTVLGSYSFRLEFKDNESASSGWYYLNNSLEIKNNIPILQDLNVSVDFVFRDDTFTIYTNSNDTETPEDRLLCELEYRAPSGDWIDFDNIDYYMDRWEGDFTPGKQFEVGLYDIRVNFTDVDGDFTGWNVVENAVDVKNNLPIISDLCDDFKVGINPKHFYLNFFESDVEDLNEQLIWKIDPTSVDTSLFSTMITDVVDDVLYIYPKDNISGEDDITLILNDKDNGTATKTDVTIYIDSRITEFTPKVKLISPLDGGIITTLTPRLEWKLIYSGDETISYRVYLDENPDPTTEIISGITSNFYTLKNDLENHKTYYWKVIPEGGLCLSFSFEFYIDLGFTPHYQVELTIDKYSIASKPGESVEINLTVKNEGNIKDLFIIEMDAGIISESLQIDDFGNIILDRNDFTTFKLSIFLSNDVPVGEHSIFYKATSFYGGDAINDTETVILKIEQSSESTKSEGRNIDISIILIWLIIIIIVILGFVVAALLRKRKKKLESEKEIAARQTEEVLLPDIVSTAATTATPQLGAAGSSPARVGLVTPGLEAAAAARTGQPPIPQMGQPLETPQLPPSPSISQQLQVTSERRLSYEEKLKLLDERLLTGDIDADTYKELRAKYESKLQELQTQFSPKLPPAQLEVEPEPSSDQVITPLETEHEPESESITQESQENNLKKENERGDSIE